MIFRFFILAILLQYSWSIPIDNGVEGDPEIECGASTITMNFNIRNNFEGKVYVRGHTNEEGCFSVERGRKVAGLNLQFTACGVERARSLNPRGVFVTASVVISFHPQFVTKVDRAYTIQCFYMEAEKTVSQQIEVSELSTLFQSQVAPMPVCRYDILDNGPTGQPIKFALIGQQVYHKWTCDTDTTDIFCMIVHTCFVDDGAANRVQILDDNGCGLDKHILQNLEYTTDLMAGRESHVFKFADRAGLFFQCQISVTTKEPGAQCPRPQCGEPAGITGGPGQVGLGNVGPGRTPGPLPPRPLPTGGTRPPVPTRNGSPPPTPTFRPLLQNRTRLRYFDLPVNFDRRSKRSAPWLDDEIGVWDVRSNHITTFDLDENENPFQKSANGQQPEKPKIFAPVLSSPSDQVFCLSPPVFGFTIAFAFASVVSVIALSVLFFRTKRASADFPK